MPLPEPDNIETMDLALDASPAVFMPTKPEVKTGTLDFYGDATPFMADPNQVYDSEGGEEDLVALDSIGMSLVLSLTETITSTDDMITNFITVPEFLTSLDFVVPVVVLSSEELVSSTDDAIASEALVIDSGEELIVSIDSVDSPEFAIIDFSTFSVEIGQYIQDNNDFAIQIAQYVDQESSLTYGIAKNTLSPVTNTFSPLNPFQPTVVINGNTIVSNTTTFPTGTDLSKTTMYLHWLSSGIDGNQWIDLWNFNFELDFYGGHFSITSRNPLKVTDPLATTLSFTDNYFHGQDGPYVQPADLNQIAVSNLGKMVSIFNLDASITDFGPTVSDNQVGWVAQGIFGSTALHRNFDFLIYGGIPYGMVIQTSQLDQSIIDVTRNNVITAKGIAAQMARLANISLQWYCNDIAIDSTFRYDGLTVLEVLATVAAQVGGVLRWDGNNNYIVAYPDQSFGMWEVPDPNLLTSNGLSYLQHLDLSTGIGQSGMVIPPVLTRYKQPQKAEASTGGNNLPAAIQRIWTSN